MRPRSSAALCFRTAALHWRSGRLGQVAGQVFLKHVRVQKYDTHRRGKRLQDVRREKNSKSIRVDGSRFKDGMAQMNRSVLMDVGWRRGTRGATMITQITRFQRP